MGENPTAAQVEFWLREVAALYPDRVQQLRGERRVLDVLLQDSDDTVLENALRDEERRESEAGRIYWQLLKSELETLHRNVARENKETSES